MSDLSKAGPVSQTVYRCDHCGDLPAVDTPPVDDPISTCWMCCQGNLTVVRTTPGRLRHPFEEFGAAYEEKLPLRN